MIKVHLFPTETPHTRKTNKYTSKNRIFIQKSNSICNKQRMTINLFLRPSIISETSSVLEYRQEKLILSTSWLSSIGRISVVKRSMKNVSIWMVGP